MGPLYHFPYDRRRTEHADNTVMGLSQWNKENDNGSATRRRPINARASFIRKRLDDLVGNIDSRAHERCLVQNQVEFFFFGDFVDNFVGSLLK